MSGPRADAWDLGMTALHPSVAHATSVVLLWAGQKTLQTHPPKTKCARLIAHVNFARPCSCAIYHQLSCQKRLFVPKVLPRMGARKL